MASKFSAHVAAAVVSLLLTAIVAAPAWPAVPAHAGGHPIISSTCDTIPAHYLRHRAAYQGQLLVRDANHDGQPEYTLAWSGRGQGSAPATWTGTAIVASSPVPRIAAMAAHGYVPPDAAGTIGLDRMICGVAHRKLLLRVTTSTLSGTRQRYRAGAARIGAPFAQADHDTATAAFTQIVAAHNAALCDALDSLGLSGTITLGDGSTLSCPD